MYIIVNGVRMERQVGIESRGIDVESGRLESGCRHDTMYNVNLQLSMCCCFILFVFFLTPCSHIQQLLMQ